MWLAVIISGIVSMCLSIGIRREFLSAILEGNQEIFENVSVIAVKVSLFSLGLLVTLGALIKLS
ncbi:hypothetical protein [Ligilactobacillus sp.]|uniref:hypothetical protein n=1 Tax=Ligilactobacillus sp. TaxID=2767921 RepID=UPI002FE06EC3